MRTKIASLFMIHLFLISCSGSGELESLSLGNIQLKKFESCEEIQKARDVDPFNAAIPLSGEQAVSSDNSGTTAASQGADSTNVQVAGVEEEDFVQTKDSFIFTLRNIDETYASSDFNAIKTEITVLKRTPATNPEKITSLKVNGSARGLYLDGDDLIVISSGYKEDVTQRQVIRRISFDGNNLSITQKRDVDGNLVASRLIKDNLHLVVNHWMPANDKVVDALPHTGTDNKDSLVRECPQIWHEPAVMQPRSFGPRVDALQCVVSLKTGNLEKEPTSQCVAGSRSSIVYASTQNLYIASNGWDDSPVHQFKLATGNLPTEYQGSVLVPGMVHDQFSMDERDSTFRIATTDRSNSVISDLTGPVSDTFETGDPMESNDNGIYIYGLNRNNPKPIGKVTGLAKGELIYAVRFVGTKAYMVTFVQVDPLFVIDLENPNNPKVLGELKIPGFSDYLHPMQDGYLLAIGKTSGFGGETQVSLFDVTDPSTPKLADQEILPGSYPYSEANYNHKAFRYDPKTNLLIIPSQDYGENSWNLHFHIFKATVENGIDLISTTTTDTSEVDSSIEASWQGRSFVNDNVLSLVTPYDLKMVGANSLTELIGETSY